MVKICNASLEELDNASLKELERILQKCIAQAEPEVVTYEESCYFFEYYKDMNASIPACTYYSRLCPGNCNKNCPWYTDKGDVDKMVRGTVTKKEEK